MWGLKKRSKKAKKKASDPQTLETSQPEPIPQPTPSVSSHGPQVSDVSKSFDPQFASLEQLRSSETIDSRRNSTFSILERALSQSHRKDPLGLTVVHEPATLPALDIIFVHGLGGSSVGTWAKERDPEYFWPQKWLSVEPEIQNARILSFGYNSNYATTGSGPIKGITEFAKDLLYSMKLHKDEELGQLLNSMRLGEDSKLKEEKDDKRPIIFVVHSLGGLVVKQAYILGQHNKKYSGFISSIQAMIFLATPHRGSNLAEILNRILKASIFHQTKQYITDLQTGSPMLDSLNEQFTHIAPTLDIVSFYENLPTPCGLRRAMVVDKASATMGHHEEISLPLQADHNTICKFNNILDTNYITVKNVLKSLMTTIAIRSKDKFQIDQEKSLIDQLKTLLAVPEDYEDDLQFFHSQWTQGTCEWILSSPAFVKWVDVIDQGPKLLWFHSLPGSGKSILSSFIVDHLRKNESFCVYHFFRFSDQSKRSLSTCLRSIAFQIAKQFPRFGRALKDLPFSTKTLEQAKPNTIWEKIFTGLLFTMELTTTMYWVVDGLDESDQCTLLVDFMQSVAGSSVPIKILFVSRQSPELISAFDCFSATTPLSYLSLEESNSDIRTYVESGVRYMRKPPKLKDQIIEKLVDGAAGNFLWASLMLTEVKRSATQKRLDKTLAGIPHGMEQLYQRMERTVIHENTPEDQELGQMILTWAICSLRPLVLTELAQALLPEFELTFDLPFAIGCVCGQFVVIDSADRLVMVHQTAKDHIVTTDSVLAVNIIEGHKKIFMKCLSVLKGQEMARDWDQRPDDKVTENQDFIGYATTSWGYHLKMLSSESDEPLLIMSSFLSGDSVLKWIAALAHQNQLRVLVSSSKSMSAYARRKRARYAATNPLLHRIWELDLIESWATDFLKILGKFGRNLSETPTSIYQHIPPFCPNNSMIYQHSVQNTGIPHLVSITGVSKAVWDDHLAKVSLGARSQAQYVACSGPRFAVLIPTGSITLFDSTTFENERTLIHGERISAMAFSNCSTLLVSYGFCTTKVWSIDTGQILQQIDNPARIRPLAIKFSSRSEELIIGSSNRRIMVAKLKTSNPEWSVLDTELLHHTRFDRVEHPLPYRVAFNSDASCVAISYRSSPMIVWSMDPPKIIGVCLRDRAYAGNGWTVVDQIIWHPNSEDILGRYMGGHVFRWNPNSNNYPQEFQAHACIIASSPEGRLFAAEQSDGTIKVYDFHHFALIYQFPCGNNSTDLCFSPDGKRLYNVAGQTCDIWEPNALIRADVNGEEESEIGSELTSTPTAVVSESFAEAPDPITAIAIQYQGRYQAIGNKAGAVSVIDTLKGDQRPIHLWRPNYKSAIKLLDWSSDGNYLAYVNASAYVIAKKIKLEKGEDWSVEPVFKVRSDLGSAYIQQILLNHDGTALLLKLETLTKIWPLGAQPTLDSSPIELKTSPDAKWTKHPTDHSLILAILPSAVRVHRWDDLSEIAAFDMKGPSPVQNPGADNIPSANIGNVGMSLARSHLLVDRIYATTDGPPVHDAIILDTSTIAIPPSSSEITPITIPDIVQDQIELPFGILNQLLIFLDKSHWVCSWPFGTTTTTDKVQRYYFLPRHWVDVDSVHLAALLADGKLLIPHNGELAVIKSVGMMNIA